VNEWQEEISTHWIKVAGESRITIGFKLQTEAQSASAMMENYERLNGSELLAGQPRKPTLIPEL
jgi:hypothetical protein